jgi:hypothetical protein
VTIKHSCPKCGKVCCEFNASGDRISTLADAAPDLLEALKYARRFLKSEDHDTDYVDSVINKSEAP